MIGNEVCDLLAKWIDVRGRTTSVKIGEGQYSIYTHHAVGRIYTRAYNSHGIERVLKERTEHETMLLEEELLPRNIEPLLAQWADEMLRQTNEGHDRHCIVKLFKEVTELFEVSYEAVAAQSKLPTHYPAERFQAFERQFFVGYCSVVTCAGKVYVEALDDILRPFTCAVYDRLEKGASHTDMSVAAYEIEILLKQLEQEGQLVELAVQRYHKLCREQDQYFTK